MLNITEKDGRITFEVRVVPRAARTELAGEIGNAVKIRVASPPVDGAANAELIKFLAKMLGVAKSGVEIVSGQTSRTKRVQITGVTAEQMRKIIT